MKHFLIKTTLLILFLNSFGLLAQAPKFYVKETTTEVTNFITGLEYYMVSSTGNAAKLKAPSFEKNIPVNRDINNPTGFFSLTINDILNIGNSPITAEIISNVWGICRVCVRLCHNPDLAEYENRPCITSSSSVNHTTLGLTASKATDAPTSLIQIQNTTCIPDTSILVQFQTNEVVGVTYTWYKNNVIFSTTTTNLSAFISVNDGDIIRAYHQELSYNLSSSINLTVNASQKPETPEVVYEAVCSGSNFMLEATSSAPEILWYEDSGLLESITTGISNNGNNLTYLADFTGTKTLYLRANNNGCFSDVKNITLTAYGNPDLTTLAENNKIFCTNEASYNLIGLNISEIQWYKDINLTDLIATTGENAVFNLNSFPDGQHTIYYKAISSNDCESQSYSVTFTKSLIDDTSPVPTVTADSELFICGDDTVAIEITGFNSYEWRLSDINGAISANPVPNNYFTNSSKNKLQFQLPPNAYKYWFRGRTALGCFTSWESVQFEVVQEVGAVNFEIISNQNNTPSLEFCKGDQLILTAKSSYATRFEFFRGTTSLGSVNAQLINGVYQGQKTINTNNIATGNHDFKVVAKSNDSDVCGDRQRAETITLYDIPDNYTIGSDKPFYNVGDLVTIEAAGNHTTGFNWYFDQQLNNALSNSIVEGISNLQLLNNGKTIRFNINKAYVNTPFDLYAVGKGNGNCLGNKDSISFNVYDNVGAIIVDNNGINRCQGNTITLIANSPNANTYKWFDSPNSSDPVEEGSIYTINTDSSTPVGQTNLWVQASLVVNNIEVSSSELFPVTYTVLSKPFNLSSSGNQGSYCKNDLVNINVTAQNTTNPQAVFAYDAAFNQLVPNERIKANNLGLQWTVDDSDVAIGERVIYYKMINENNCESGVSSLTITFNSEVGDLSVTGNQGGYCTNQEIEILVGASGASTYQWFLDENATIPYTDNITGVNNNTFRLNANNNNTSGNFTYYVQAINTSGCNGELVKITFDVQLSPSNLEVSTVNDFYCTAQNLIVTPSASNALSYQWAYDSNFNNMIPMSLIDANGALNYTPNETGTTVYYVRAQSNLGCFSDTVIDIEINVQQGVEFFEINQDQWEVCQGEPIEIIVNAEFVDEFGFYYNTSGTTPIDFGVQTNGNLNIDTQDMVLGMTTIYAIAKNNNGCNSLAYPIEITVLENTEATIAIDGDNEVCVGELLSVNLNTTGVNYYEWYIDDQGTVLANDINIITNGTVNHNAYYYTGTTILSRDYWIRGFNNNGCSTELTPLSLNVVEVSNVNVITTTNTFCQSILEFEASGVNVSAFKWYADPNGVSEITTTSGALNEVLSLDKNNEIGDFTIYLQGLNDNGCESDITAYSFTVLVAPKDLQISNLKASYCIGETIDITITSQNTDTYTFAYDSDFNTLVEADRINQNGNGILFLTDTAFNQTIYYKGANNNGCESETDSFELNVYERPVIPQTQHNDLIVCQGSELLIEVDALGHTLRWFSDPNLDNEITANIVDNAFVLNSNETANLNPREYTMYVVNENDSNCFSEPLEINYTIFQRPTVPTFINNSPNYCTGDFVSIDFSSFGSEDFKVGLTSDYVILADPLELKFNTAGKIIGLEYLTNDTHVGSKTYFIKGINENCESETIVLSFTILQGVLNFEVTSNQNDNAVCQGDTIIFTASTANSGTQYTWYNSLGDVVHTLPVFTIATDNLDSIEHFYSVEAKNTNTCLERKDFSFVVKPKPQQIQIDGETTYCLGNEVELSLSGIDVSTFEWYYGNNTNNPVEPQYLSGNQNQYLNYTTNFNGTLTIYYRAVNDDGCASELENINIITNDVPNPILINNGSTTPITACKGDELLVLVSSSSGTIFNWYEDSFLTTPVSPNFLDGANNQLLKIDTNLINEGYYTYYVFAENSSGCVNEAVEVNFEIFENPSDISFSGETEKCLNELMAFELVSSNITEFNWYLDEFGNIPVGIEYTTFNNGASIKFTPESSGTFYLFYQGETVNGCITEMAFVEYTINEKPNETSVSITDDTLCFGEEVYIQSGGNGVSNFYWYKDSNATILLEDIYVSGALNDIVNFVPEAIGTTNLWVQAENNSGCLGELLQVSFTVFEQPSLSEISINNDPNNNQIIIGEPIELSWNAQDQQGFRILHNNIQIFPNTPAPSYETSTANLYEVTPSAVSTDTGNYTVEIINAECLASSQSDVYVFDVVLELFNTKPENEVTETDVFGNEITYIEIEQNESIGFFTNLSNPVYEQEWFYGDNHSNLGQEVIHYYNEEGIYEVQVKFTNTITGDFIERPYDKKVRVKEFKGTATIDDLDPPSDDTFSFYPNPVQQKLNLKIHMESTEDVVLRIYNINGLILFVEQFTALQGENTFIWNNPLYNVDGGGAVYFAQISYSDTIKTYKLIKN